MELEIIESIEQSRNRTSASPLPYVGRGQDTRHGPLREKGFKEKGVEGNWAYMILECKRKYWG